MLAKSLKLNLSNLETKNIYTSGYFFKTKNFTANFDLLSEINQFAVIIPKKKVALATQRNFWKRFVFDYLNDHLTDFRNKNIRLIVRLTSNPDENKQLKLKKELQTIIDFVNKK